MGTRRAIWRSLLALPLLSVASRRARAEAPAQTPTPPAAAVPPGGAPGLQTLTVFLRHDETKTVTEINQHLKQTGFFDHFPPAGVEVLSWYVMMGIGQVVTLRFPAERLREINYLLENEAWGGFRTEFYPTYDYRALYASLQSRMKSQ